MKRSRRSKKSGFDIAFVVFNTIVLTIFCIVTLYPILDTLAVSFNEAVDTLTGGIHLVPRKFTLENYRTVSRTRTLMHSAYISVLRTVLGTLLHMVLTSLLAYVLSSVVHRARIGRDYARSEQGEGYRVAADECRMIDGFRIDLRAYLGGFGLEQRSIGAYGNAFRDSAHFHRHIHAGTLFRSRCSRDCTKVLKPLASTRSS